MLADELSDDENGLDDKDWGLFSFWVWHWFASVSMRKTDHNLRLNLIISNGLVQNITIFVDRTIIRFGSRRKQGMDCEDILLEFKYHKELLS